MDAVLVYGQSNAGTGGDTPATFNSATLPERAVGFERGGTFWGATPIVPELVSGVARLQSSPHHPLMMMVPAAVALEQFIRGAGPPPRWFWHTVDNGGQPISQFLKGTQTYTNLMTAANRFAAVTRDAGTTPTIRAIVWVQGESPSPNYAVSLFDLISTLFPDIMARTGQTIAPRFLVFQINNSIAEPWINQVALDQLSVARNNPNCALVSPMYYTPLELFTVSPPTGIHGTEIGRMMAGEMLALCCKALFHDMVDWTPLVPLGLGWTGSEITIRFSKPTYGNGLAWDTAWVGPSANYGFFYGDDQSSSEIASVALDSANYRVKLTLTRPPTGTKPFVSYAMGPGGQTVLAPWPGNRGQLISPTAQHSVFRHLGYALPQMINHYGARFQLPVM
jgi:hypothetical protein